METRELTCICCPMGCSMTAEIENHEVVKVTGNTCPRGAAYAKKEITSPSRTVTSSVHVTHGKLLMASVKTKEEVPKERIMDVMGTGEFRGLFDFSEDFCDRAAECGHRSFVVMA